MFSKSSLLEKSKCTKNRIFAGWIVCIVAMIIAYPIMQMISMREIDSIKAYGVYLFVEQYISSLSENVQKYMIDYPVPLLISTALGIAVAFQSFAFLFSRRKVNLYFSVPVAKEKRFVELYTRAVAMYVVALIVAIVSSFIFLEIKGILTAVLVAKLILAAIFNLLLYLCIVNFTIWAMMLTGKFYMAIIIDLVLIAYVDVFEYIIKSFSSTYFKTLCDSFTKEGSGYSIWDICLYANKSLFNPYSAVRVIWWDLVIAAIKMFAWVFITFMIARSSYRKRPAESAESVVAFYSLKVLMKLFICIPLGLVAGINTQRLLMVNQVQMIAIIIITIVIVGMLLEAAYNSALLPALGHWGSITVSIILALAIYAFFRFDIVKYDEYVPAASAIESYAVINQDERTYSEAVDFEAYPLDFQAMYIEPYSYAKENMMLLDTDTIVALARKSIESDIQDMKNPVAFDVYYRLKKGGTRARTIWIDLADSTNDLYLNRIIGPAYYKKGIWQAFDTDIPDNVDIDKVTYFDGIQSYSLDTAATNRIVSLWRSDMVGYDYNKVRYYREAGYITIVFSNYMTWKLPVYDSFTNVKSYLLMGEKLELTEIAVDQIDEICITKVDNAGYTKVIDASEDIAVVLSKLEKVPAHTAWIPADRYAKNYKVEIKLNEGYTSSYGCNSLFCYSILTEGLEELDKAGFLP